MNLKNYLLAASFALTFGLNSVVAQKSANIGVVSGCTRQYIVDESGVNHSLDSLCRDPFTVREDAWCLHDNVLIDIGFGEQPSTVYLSLPLISNIFFKTRSGDTLWMYHIHQDSYRYDRFSPPSSIDIIYHAKMKNMAGMLGIKLCSRMFDGHGAWTFDVKKDFIESVNDDSLMDNKTRILDSLIGGYCEKYNSADLYNTILMDKYISKLDSVGVILEFVPKAFSESEYRKYWKLQETPCIYPRLSHP